MRWGEVCLCHVLSSATCHILLAAAFREAACICILLCVRDRTPWEGRATVIEEGAPPRMGGVEGLVVGRRGERRESPSSVSPLSSLPSPSFLLSHHAMVFLGKVSIFHCHTAKTKKKAKMCKVYHTQNTRSRK